MKKIGLTLDDNTYEIIKEIAENNEMTPTTICSLIISTRVDWYIRNNFEPRFGKKYFEECTRTMSEETARELNRIAKTRWLDSENDQ